MKIKLFRGAATGAMTVALLIGSSTFANTSQANEVIDGWNVDAAILIEASTGKVLYADNVDAPLGIASMSKMMTEYLLLEAIEAGDVTWDQTYRVTQKTFEISQDTSLSNVPLRLDETYTIQELYEAMTIYSANAATIAIAETIAGSEDEFIKLMNEKSAELGLEEYNFVNSSGLNNADMMGYHPESTDVNAENTMSARDTAKLASRLLNDFPEVLETASISRTTFREGTDDATEMPNWNFMLPGLTFEYEGADGIKTGTTDFAGYTFTGTAEREGMRLISVVMNATDENGVGSYAARFESTRDLFDYGFDNFSLQEIVPGDFTVEGEETIGVDKGKEDSVSIASTDPISMVVQNGQGEGFEPALALDDALLNEDGELTAPVEEGDVVGSLSIQEGEDGLGFLNDNAAESVSVDVVAKESVEKANWFTLSMRAVGGFFSGVWDSAYGWVKGLF